MNQESSPELTASPAISVIMPCHNRGFDLLRVLQAYDDQETTQPFEIIAIDDASTDNTLDILRSFKPHKYALVIQNFDQNKGPAAARNLGISLVKAPLILFVGDDIYPSRSFVSGHIQAHSELTDDRIAILGLTSWAHDVPSNTLMAHIDGVGAQQFSYQYLQHGEEYDYRHLYTSNISVKRNLLLALDHWFDVDFAFAAFEDVELAYRLARLGLRIVYNAHITAEHYHYHTIWSFAERQWRSGRMAWVLMHKHPLVASKLLRPQLLRQVPALWWLVHTNRTNRQRRMCDAQYLEDLSLHLASYYEWSDNVILDEFYIELLQYFYHKGLLSGFFSSENKVEMAQWIYTNSTLMPLLQWFRDKAVSLEIDIPVDLFASLQQLG
jgi:glycosyltransferase involved in cell wall biosynthesis